MLNILSWYLIVQLFALAGLPLALAWLHRLPSRGYAVAKALGLLLTGVLFWWGSIIHLWSNTASGALMAAVLICGMGLWMLRGRWAELRAWWAAHHEFVITTELLFAAAFLLWVIVRAAQPQIETAGGEKFMEIAFLNAVLRAPGMPPHDPWLSGYAISYYYLGYHLMGMITRLASVPASSAFNLGIASWFALTAVSAYGVLYDMLDGRGPVRALFGPLLLLLTGNGMGLLEVLYSRGLFPPAFWTWLDIRGLNAPPQPPFSWLPSRFFWWWRASRTLHDYTPGGVSQELIDEFPAFSFILGDMHPHLLVLPFALLLVALALHLYHDAHTFERDPDPWRYWSARVIPLAGCALLLGSLGFLNTWDLPIYWALLMGALILGRGRAPDAPELFDRLWAAIPEGGLLGVLSIIYYLPFWIGLRSQAGGILPNLFNATRPVQFVVMFIPLLLPVAALIIGAARRVRLDAYKLVSWSIGVLLSLLALALLMGLVAGYPWVRAVLEGEAILGIAPEQFQQALFTRLSSPWTALLLLLGVMGVVLAFIEGEHKLRPPHTFALLLTLLGCLLTLAPEFVFLKDVFMTRMNTVFKFYFQAWVLWSLAGAWWLATTTEALSRRAAGTARRVGYSAAILAILAGLVYTPLAARQRALEHGIPWTLDGADWVRQQHPADWEAIQWLNAYVEGAPVIAEAPGDNHRAYVYQGRISAFTGLPTVLGWAGHEMQWRGNYEEQAQRELALTQLYASGDTYQVQEIVARYSIAYIYVGPIEQQTYPPETLEVFEQLYPLVYQNAGVSIYQTGF